MTTTIMRDSQVGDAWIQQTMLTAPMQWVAKEDGSTPTDFLTGPVRLAFPNLIAPTKNDRDEDIFNSALLFPPGADLSIAQAAYYGICGQEFADYYDVGTQQYQGLGSPFHDQAEKCAKYTGYTPGAMFVNANTRYKPSVVDTHYNPIVDPSKVYAGVWAILSLNAYSYGRVPPRPKKGVSFGIQTVMIIGDDKQLAGGGPDPRNQFGGVAGAFAPPTVSSGQVQGMPGAGAPPGAPPGAPMPGAPVGGTYAMPGTPAPAPAAADPRGPVPAGFASWAEHDQFLG